MTEHAVARAVQRGVKIREIIEGRAHVQQILDKDGRFLTVIPSVKKQKYPPLRLCPEFDETVESCMHVG